jgi:hypothetical protein
MDVLERRIDEYCDDEAKQRIIQYLDKCVTRYFNSMVTRNSKRLADQGVDKDHAHDLTVLNMVHFGLITKEKGRTLLKNQNVRIL